MNGITIEIYKSEEEKGYSFDIYQPSPNGDDKGDIMDGGQCTTSLKNAIDMACEQAKSLINNHKQNA